MMVCVRGGCASVGFRPVTGRELFLMPEYAGKAAGDAVFASLWSYGVQDKTLWGCAQDKKDFLHGLQADQV